MARFDVYRNPDGIGYVLDVQSDLFDDYRSRVVVPLLPPDVAPNPVSRLNPQFEIEDSYVTLLPHFIASVPTEALGRAVTSLAEEDYAIGRALDMMLKGF